MLLQSFILVLGLLSVLLGEQGSEISKFFKNGLLFFDDFEYSSSGVDVFKPLLSNLRVNQQYFNLDRSWFHYP